MSCSCCGEAKATASLRSRDDVELCRDCLEWLLGRIGVTSTPTLPVADLGAAVAFYEAAGFGVRIDHDDDDGFVFVDFDGQSVFDLDVAPTWTPHRTGRAAASLRTMPRLGTAA